jgi:hypothetical protein
LVLLRKKNNKNCFGTFVGTKVHIKKLKSLLNYFLHFHDKKVYNYYMLSALDLLKEELKNARETFESTTADIQEDHLHKTPGGKALPLGATYAHLIFSEDTIVHGMLQGKPPLFATSWKDKTGASAPMPAMDEKWAESNETWANSVTVDLPKMRKYAKAVFAATDEYVNSLKNEDLTKEIDLGSWGKKTVWFLLAEYIIGHTFSLTGEISVLKGLQGAKGYPY